MENYNTNDLLTEVDATIQANDDNIYIEYYNAGSSDAVKNKKALFKTLAAEAVGSDTAWTTVTTLLNGWTGTVVYIKRAGMVTVCVNAVVGTGASSIVLLTLPAGYRPENDVWASAHIGSVVNTTTLAQVAPTGSISIYNYASVSTARVFFTYPVL